MRVSQILAGLLVATATVSAIAQPMPRPSQPQRPAGPGPGAPQEADMSPTERAQMAAVARYQHGLEGFLRASASPRDQALSVQVMHADDRDGPDPDDPARGELLRRAAEAAPNDRLVQWTWAIAPAEVSGCVVTRPCRDRGNALARLEPDNGAAWVPVVADAIRFNDAPRVADALTHMAAATRYDEVFHDAMGAWMDAFRRFPAPAELMRSPDGAAADASLAAGTFALAQVENASAPYEELLHACQRNGRAGAATALSASCAQAGRLMIDRATTLVGRAVGADLLRSAAAPTPEDRERVRTNAWLAEQHVKLSGRDANGAQAHARMGLLIASESEVAAVQDELRRANVALTPPAGWQPARPTRPAGPPAQGQDDADPMPDGPSR